MDALEIKKVLEFHANCLCAYLAAMGLEEMTIGAHMLRGAEEGQNYCVIVMKDDSSEVFEGDDEVEKEDE